MINPIETYANAGQKAAKAIRNHDQGTYSHFNNWARRATSLESEPDRILARKAFTDAYLKESGFVPHTP